MNNIVYEYLTSHNFIETQQLKTGHYVPNFATLSLHPGKITEISEKQFLNKEPIYI